MEDKHLDRLFRRLKFGIGGLFLFMVIAVMAIIKLAMPSQGAEQDNPERNAEFMAQTIAQILSPVAVSPLLEDDELTLNEIITSVKTNMKEVLYIEILKPDGKVLAHTDFDKIGTIETIKEGIGENESLYLFTSPIKLGERTIAYMSLGLNKGSFFVKGVRPEGFSTKMILLVLSIFGGLLFLSLLFSTGVQKSALTFLKDRIRAKEAEMEKILREKRRLQELVEKNREPKPILEPISTNQTLEAAVDKLFADFVKKEKKIDTPKAQPEMVEQKGVVKIDKWEKEVKEIEKLLEELEEPIQMLKESKTQNGEESIVPETPTGEYEPAELGEFHPALSAPQVDVTKIANGEEESAKLAQRDGINIISIVPLPCVLGKQLEIRFSLSDETPLLGIIDSPEGELIRIFNIQGKRGENLLTWDGKSYFGDFVKPGEYTITITEKNPGGVRVSAKINVVARD